MKISVLMSVYKNDNADYLKLALESIYEKQTRKPDEIVIVFDGKLTDSLYNVLDDFKKNKESIVFYYPQNTNKGLGEALRIGTEKCTGDYIFRMDSDDISDSKRFEKQIEYIETHPYIDVLGTDIAEFDLSPDESDMRLRVCPQTHNEIVKMGKKRNPMNHVTVAIKKTALKKCGGYETVLLLEDYYLWLKMIASDCVLENLNEPLVYVRVGNGFNEKRGSKVRITGWKTLQKYMLKHKMINRIEAVVNMVYIIGFTYCPNIIRRLVYEKLLRK